MIWYSENVALECFSRFECLQLPNDAVGDSISWGEYQSSIRRCVVVLKLTIMVRILLVLVMCMLSEIVGSTTTLSLSELPFHHVLSFGLRADDHSPNSSGRFRCLRFFHNILHVIQVSLFFEFGSSNGRFWFLSACRCFCRTAPGNNAIIDHFPSFQSDNPAMDDVCLFQDRSSPMAPTSLFYKSPLDLYRLPLYHSVHLPLINHSSISTSLFPLTTTHVSLIYIHIAIPL